MIDKVRDSLIVVSKADVLSAKGSLETAISG